MPRSTERYKNYLSSYVMHTNSIHFRISSSKAIEKWKNVQSFQLNQIANGKFYFSKDRKEILLLKYDMWSRFIYEVENLLIELSGNHPENIVQQEHMDSINELANKTGSVYEDAILNKFKENFDEDFSRLWINVHSSSFDLVIFQMKSLIGYTFEHAFTMLVDILTKAMQYTLIEIHELNCMFCHFVDDSLCGNRHTDKIDIPFLIYTPFDVTNDKLLKTTLIKKRFDLIRERFDLKEIYIKNYCDERIPSEVFDYIESSGVKINYRMNY